ncbi:hypothetical protein Rfer_4300 (plasmid) [Rhodoferax ferrireducens T118]|uniref:Uncharacterized protein n=1 Tax=Albidiferax ferrireducens (strain ATCC BAA-621 / DSM 15236 / T118) TaxID=338969 RepID=Q21QF9_ALBFT|nr:hypothetical protein Rfer_4300 [Rhodoferax ferrireducens T118]
MCSSLMKPHSGIGAVSGRLAAAGGRAGWFSGIATVASTGAETLVFWGLGVLVVLDALRRFTVLGAAGGTTGFGGSGTTK